MNCQMNEPRIGYLGMGLMGMSMTLRLLGDGYSVTVWNRTPEKCAAAVGAGATQAATPAEVAGECDILLMCLIDAKAVEAVVFGDNGVASASSTPLLADFSTLHPDTSRNLAERLKAATGADWLDAPVSGGTPAAEAGALTFMVGGAEESFDTLRPVLETLGRNITHMGPVGSGQMTKLVNQVISGCTMAVVAEAVNLAEKSGVDAKRLASALAGGFADSKPFQLLAPRMAGRSFENPLGTVATMLKDIDAVIEFGDANAAMLPMTRMALEMLNATVDCGHADEDISTLILAYSQDD